MADGAQLSTTIIEIVAEEAGQDTSAITPQSNFAADLDIDSLGLLTIATQVEEACGVSLDDAVIPNLETVGALIELVEQAKAA